MGARTGPADGESAEVVVLPPTEIYLSTEDAFDRDVQDAVERGAGTVVVDFSGVRFCDSAALRVLGRHADDLGAVGRRVVVRNPTAALVRLLALTGTPEDVRGLRLVAPAAQ